MSEERRRPVGGSRSRPAPERRPDASMTLIRTMMERPLDPGYAAAAERREAQGGPRGTSLRSPLLAAASVVIGLVVGVAASNLTADDSPRAAARADLVRQIEQRRGEVDRLATQAQDLQARVAAREASGLAVSNADAERSRRLATVVGAVPLEGPGLTVTLDDAPDAADTAGDGDKRVFARDLQFVVNALWEAGAEAVSINGNRLTSGSSIRFAGSAIIVNFRPLARPYVVTAIGNPRELPTRFADGPGGSYVSTLHSTFGVRADTDVSDDLTVPAAVRLTTRYATIVDTGSSPASGAPADTDTEGGSS